MRSFKGLPRSRCHGLHFRYACGPWPRENPPNFGVWKILNIIVDRPIFGKGLHAPKKRQGHGSSRLQRPKKGHFLKDPMVIC